MPRPRVRLNSGGMGGVLHSPEVRDWLLSHAESVAATARAIAPVESGAYRDSIEVEAVQNPSRVVARVVADVEYAMNVEASTGTLNKALGSAGMRGA